MSKVIRGKVFLTSFVIISVILMIVIKAANDDRRDFQKNYNYNPPLFGSEIYLSNRYTMPDGDQQFEYGEFLIPESFDQIAENNRYILFFEEETLSIKLKDKQSSYVWSSQVDNIPEGENNAQTENFMKSGVSIDYYSYNTKDEKTSTKTKRTDIISENAVTRVTEINNGIKVNVNFAKLQISFDVEITLTDSGVKTHIPNGSINEDKNIIAAIYVMPFMGATRLDDIPGYMFVPDGSGALIRHTNNEGKSIKQYAARYSGIDYGLTKNIANEYWQVAPERLTAPVFGMVHGVNQNGFIGIIENGSVNAELLVNPNGAGRINYNWISPRFILRETTFIPTDLAGNGIQVLEPTKKPDDITVIFNFLNEQNANYVGMAKSYQEYLVTENILTKSSNAPLMRLEILASDSEKGLFGPKITPMTSAEDMKRIVSDLRNHNVDDLLLIVRGWNEGGMSGQSPYEISYERKVGSTRDFNDFMTSMEKNNIPVYYYNDYVIGYSDSERVNANRDVAKALYKMQLEFDLVRQPVYDKYFYVNPLISKSVAKNDLNDYDNLGINNLALDSIGHTSFSFVDDKVTYHASDSVRIYAEIAAKLANNGQLAMYEPNHYMWQYTTEYLDMPLYSSQFNFYTDNVPFLQIVFKGYMNYYAPFTNFFANHDEQILQLIDYGMYPSFIITDEPSYKLKYTNANEFYTTEYSDWRSTIIEDYKLVSETLEQVSDATITNRTVLDAGIVRVDYSNGVSFVINYSTEDFEYQNGSESITIKKQNFMTLGVVE